MLSCLVALELPPYNCLNSRGNGRIKDIGAGGRTKRRQHDPRYVRHYSNGGTRPVDLDGASGGLIDTISFYILISYTANYMKDSRLRIGESVLILAAVLNDAIPTPTL